MYNGHQLHRMHHRQYFDLIRERKSPGRPPRNTDNTLSVGWKNNYEVTGQYSLNASLLSFPTTESNQSPLVTEPTMKPTNQQTVKVELLDDSSNNSEGTGSDNTSLV